MVTQFSENRSPYSPLWYENEQLLMLGLVAFTTGLVATCISALLDAPIRQIIFVGGGMMTLLSAIFWLGVVSASLRR